MPNSNPNLDRWVALASTPFLIAVLSGYTLVGRIESPNGAKVDVYLAPPGSYLIK
jgi:hypothetical protein